MSLKLSESDQKLLVQAWRCCKTTPEINYAELAKVLGHTNKDSTRNAFKRLMKKLGDGSATDDSPTDSPVVAPEAESRDNLTTDAEPPVKKRRRNPAAQKKKDAVNDDEPNDDGVSSVKKEAPGPRGPMGEHIESEEFKAGHKRKLAVDKSKEQRVIHGFVSAGFQEPKGGLVEYLD